MANNTTATKKPVRLDMTGEDFKKLIEQKDSNGVVDTLKEVLAMFDGIGDNETIAEYIKRTTISTTDLHEEEIGIGTAEARTIVSDAIAAAERELEEETEDNSR